MSMTQRYASVHDAAAYLGITESALRCRVQRGQVPFIKEDSGRLTFDFSELDRYLAARRRTGTSLRRTLPTQETGTHGHKGQGDEA